MKAHAQPTRAQRTAFNLFISVPVLYVHLHLPEHARAWRCWDSSILSNSCLYRAFCELWAESLVAVLYRLPMVMPGQWRCCCVSFPLKLPGARTLLSEFAAAAFIRSPVALPLVGVVD
jgi:hypothetical protein